MDIFFFFFFDEETDTTQEAPMIELPEEVSIDEYNFFNENIRFVWHKQEEEWYFSIVDVVGVLTEQPDLRHAAKYWSVLKTRLKQEGSELTTNCSQLKLKAADGKMRKTDVANMEELFRIIQSIPSPKAEPFKMWLVQLERKHIDDIELNSFNNSDTSPIEATENMFDDIKHIDDAGNEYWLARELQKILDYTEFNKFVPVINKAKTACSQSGFDVDDHFADASEMVQIGSGAQREFDSYKLSRFACYLIAQNGDSRKRVIALAQTYFATQTRRQELQDEYDSLSEDQKRLAIRDELKEHNKSLAEAAKMAGVDAGRDYAIFQNKGYRGLYGGLGAKEIHNKKGLKKSQKILDHMGSEELAANLFRATQTDAKLRREKTQGKGNANKAHFEVGKKVRQTIEDLGGTMPEDLPTPDKSVKQLEKTLSKSIVSSSNAKNTKLLDDE